MRSKIVRIGGSRGIRIPRALLEQARLRDSDEIEVADGALVVRCADGPRSGWDAAFARMAAAAGLSVTPHSANLSLVTMCTMHLLGAIPNAGKYLELSIEGADYYPWQQELFIGDPYRVEAGRVQIPSAPGWGVEINPAWLARAEHRRAA